MTMEKLYVRILSEVLIGVACVGYMNLTAGEETMTYRLFTVTDQDGKMVSTTPIPPEKTPLWARNVSQEQYARKKNKVGDAPIFRDLIPFVRPPLEGSGEPFYIHNHCPALTWCENGDLLAVWYTTKSEAGSELTIVASRLRAGNDEWDPSSEFFKCEHRNMHGSAMFHDGHGKIYHINGVRKHPGGKWWARLALVLRTSTDNGVTWTAARPISRGAGYAEERADEIAKGSLEFPASGGEYKSRHQPIAGTIMTRDGVLIQPCDGTPGPEGPTALHISRDGGETWTDPGGDIRGIHAGVVELKDGRLMALGRKQDIDGKMPMSISDDLGKTWTYKASPFPPIGGGQRLVLMRLNEGPIMLVSFANKPMTFKNRDGKQFEGTGLFAALSYDEGETWPLRKLITPRSGVYECGGHTKDLWATPTRAESAGYLAATQPPDNMIHLISSRLHYRFNLAWLEKPNIGSKEEGMPKNAMLPNERTPIQQQLVSYFAPAAPATRRPATGNEPFLRPEIGFTPKCYRQHLDIDFGETWHRDVWYRRETVQAMRAELAKRFPGVGVGNINRPVSALDLQTSVFGETATVAIFGLPIINAEDTSYAEDN